MTNISAREYKPKMDKVQNVLGSVIYDQPNAIPMALCAMLSGKHVLLTSLRGRGKTALSRFIQMIIEGAVEARIQGTPGTNGSDFTGKTFYNEELKKYVTDVAKAMEAHIVLFDEVNRPMEAIQAFLMELLEEGQVTINGVTYKLPPFHFWIGTRNPEGQAGTTRMSEAFKDRWILDTDMAFPSRNGLIQLGRNTKLHRNVATIEPLLGMNEILDLVKYNDHMVDGISDSVLGYAADLVTYLQTDMPEFRKLVFVPDPRRDLEYEKLRLKDLIGKPIFEEEILDDGLSPRAFIWMQHAAAAWAFLDGADEVRHRDIDAVFTAAGRHKLCVRPLAKAMNVVPEDILNAAHHYVKHKLRHRG